MKKRSGRAGHRCHGCGNVTRPNKLTSTRYALLCSKCVSRLPDEARVDVQPWPIGRPA
jgi:hypothetical protein